MKSTTTIQFKEEICTIEYDQTYEPQGSKQKHTILYISNPFSPEELNWKGITEQPPHSVKGDDPDNDKIWRKYNKAEVDLQRIIINQAVQDGLIAEDFAKQLKWSRKAGCQCGCSPGWRARDYGRKSAWLNVKSPSKEEEKKKRQEEYAAKKEAETLTSLCI